MIKILYGFNGLFHKGGTEAVILNILQFIDSSKFEIEILVHGTQSEFESNEIQNQLIASGVKLHRVTPRSISLKQNLRDIRRILRENNYDIVHSHMDASGYFLLREAKKLNVKGLFAHSHNSDSGLLKSGLSIKEAAHYILVEFSKHRLRRIGNYFIGCSDLAGDWLFGKKIVDSENYMMFRNAIDLRKFEFSESIREQYREKLNLNDKFVVGHIGRFEEQKNHSFLIDIFEQIRKLDQNSVLLLVGKGKLETDIKNKIDKLGISDRVIFLGVRDDITELLNAMDVLLFPSLYEGLPVVFVEAQANGLKIVASDTISKDSMLTNDIITLPLSQSSIEWAHKTIDFTGKKSRNNNFKALRDQGFDMQSNVKELEKTYERMLNDKR